LSGRISRCIIPYFFR